MEEKKLTNDTEIDVGMIVKAFDCCRNNNCERCPLGEVECNVLSCETFVMKKTLDLIHRLQDENAEYERKLEDGELVSTDWHDEQVLHLQAENESLTKQIEELSKPRKKILANKVYSDSTLKKWTKEQLIEQIRILEHNWACAEETFNNSVKNSDKIFSEQKAEIERLMKLAGDKELKAIIAQNCVLNEENAELQKQVDELTEERANLQAEIATQKLKYEALKCGRSIAVGICEVLGEAKKTEIRQQAVKDTAKEILQGLIDKAYVNECIDLTVAEVKAWFREDYCVEVE